MLTRVSLASLLSGFDARYDGDADTAVTGIAYDSRRVAPGNVFVAVPGFVHDGLRFVPDAVAAGAAAVVAQAPPAGIDRDDVVWAQVADGRAVLAPMAAAFYGNPSQALKVVGITGTNGKTTVAALLERLLAANGPTGRCSTTTVSVAGHPSPALRTTPEGPELQAILRDMVEAGCWAAAIEVSSHALDLHRVDGTAFAAAVFTNLSDDHLDFHADRNAYLASKAKLFERLAASAVAVLNVGDPASALLRRHTAARVVGYGWKTTARAPEIGASADAADAPAPGSSAPSPRGAPAASAIDVPTYWIAAWDAVDGGSKLRLETPAGELEFASPLFGAANAENLTAAIAMALELGLTPAQISAPVADFAGARGRFQRLMAGQPFTVLVDFAHTPGALRAALAAARDLAGAHRVIVVFGCGGDRDRGKRPLMGEIAAAGADRVLVTSDNPRSEDPEAIVDDIVAGMPDAASGTRREHIVDRQAAIERIVDRQAAIERALAGAQPGDCVLIAGKGHETEQIFANRTIEFDDVAVAENWLRRRYPPPHPPLPPGGDS